VGEHQRAPLPVISLVSAVLAASVSLILGLPAAALAAIVLVASSAAWGEMRSRASRRRDRASAALSGEREAFEIDVERSLARLRAELFDRVSARGGSTEILSPVVLGRGLVESGLIIDDGGRLTPLALEDGPLAVAAERGIRVLAPPDLAEAMVRRYASQVLEGADVFEAVGTRRGSALTITVSRHDRSCVITSSRDSVPDEVGFAEVWFGPEGEVCARTPAQLGGAWVPLAMTSAQAATDRPAPTRMPPTITPPPVTRSRVRSRTRAAADSSTTPSATSR
jgi:hypothetical protein